MGSKTDPTMSLICLVEESIFMDKVSGRVNKLFEPIAPIMLLLVLLGSMAQEDQVLCIPYWGSLMQRAVN